MAIMKVLKDGVELQSVDLNRAGKPLLVVGRAADSDVKLDDRAIGREHAVLSINAKGISIQKKTKFGRLAINGAEVADGIVKTGDVVSIADYLLRFEDDAAPPAPASSADTAGAALTLAPELGDAPELSADGGAEAGEIRLGDGVPELGATSDAPAGPTTSETPMVDEAQAGAGPTLEAPSEASLKIDEPSHAGGTGSGSVGGAPLDGDGGDRTAMISTAKVVSRFVFAPGAANVEDFIIKKPEISLGRGTNCDIVLTDKKSSRKHLVIKRVGMSFVAQDQGSANGTYVNGVKITEQELAGDDVLRIGETEFTFKATSQEYFEQQGNFSAPVIEEEPPAAGGEMLALEGGGGLPMDQGGGAQAGGGIDPALAGATTGAIPGLGQSGPAKKETLLDKFKRQPTPRKIMIGGLALIAFYVLLEGEEPKKDAPKPQSTVMAGDSRDASFNALPKERKEFVINTYNLALDYYKGQQFEKAIYEVKKLLEVLPAGYKDALDIKKYAEKSLDVIKAADDERKRKEAEEKMRAEVEELVKQAQALVDQGKEMEAKDVFAQVLERDPDNPTILRLRQQIEEKEQKRKADAEAAREIEFKRKQLELLVKEGRELLRAGKYYEAIDKMAEAPVVYAGDEKLLGQAKQIIVEAKDALKNKILPFLKAGQEAMADGNYPAARDNFFRVLKIDVKHAEAKRGIAQIRTVLHERAKKIYIDGIMLEGVSDYRGAKAKYAECVKVAMRDDRYFDSCSRKGKRLEFIDRGIGGEAPSGAPEASNDPSMPKLPSPVDVSGESP